MQIGEENLACPQPRYLLWLRLLDLQDHLGLSEDGVGVFQHLCALLDVLGVADRRALAGALLNHDAVAMGGQLAHARRGNRYAVFVDLYLRRDANLH